MTTYRTSKCLFWFTKVFCHSDHVSHCPSVRVCCSDESGDLEVTSTHFSHPYHAEDRPRCPRRPRLYLFSHESSSFLVPIATTCTIVGSRRCLFFPSITSLEAISPTGPIFGNARGQFSGTGIMLDVYGSTLREMFMMMEKIRSKKAVWICETDGRARTIGISTWHVIIAVRDVIYVPPRWKL